MSVIYISSIVKYIDQKIVLLNKFREITSKIADSDFDSLAGLIAERQVVINDIDNKTEIIKNIISEQTDEVSGILSKLIRFEKVECSNEYKPVQEKSTELENLLIQISEEEKAIHLKMENVKKGLEEDMLKSNKSRKVLDYFNSFVGNASSGNTFNSVT